VAFPICGFGIEEGERRQGDEQEPHSEPEVCGSSRALKSAVRESSTSSRWRRRTPDSEEERDLRVVPPDDSPPAAS